MEDSSRGGHLACGRPRLGDTPRGRHLVGVTFYEVGILRGSHLARKSLCEEEVTLRERHLTREAACEGNNCRERYLS